MKGRPNRPPLASTAYSINFASYGQLVTYYFHMPYVTVCRSSKTGIPIEVGTLHVDRFLEIMKEGQREQATK